MGARAHGNAAKAASREKLRVRERQTAMLVGQLAAQLEDKKPGRIFAVRLTCTRYKSTGTIVFNQRRVRAPMNEHDAEDDLDDDDSDDESDADPGPGSGPLTHTGAVSKPLPAAPRGAAGAAEAATKQRGAGGITVTSPGWQQPRRPTRQPQAKPKKAKPPAADRNAISARGSAQLEPGQLSALANSINQISKEVCPGSAFTVTKQLPIDGRQVAVQMLPTCMAAEALRHATRRPRASASNAASSPATARSCVRCSSPSSRCHISVATPTTPVMSTWGSTCSTNNSDTGRSCRDDGCVNT